jgi:hypothetical protein
MARKKDRGLQYIRRNSTKQEIGLPAQVYWAIGMAAQHGVRFDASIIDLEHMQANNFN